MAELTLAQEQRISLRAQAHRLHPIVRLGAAGLSEAVFQEIDRALRSHGLIKVRAVGAQRTDRGALSRAIAERLDAAQVQVIGSIVVLYRPIAEEPAPGPALSGSHATALGSTRKNSSSAKGKPSPPRRPAKRRSPQR